MINYPSKPWEDGQQFKTVDSNNEEIVGTYDASKNAWTFARLQEGILGGGIGFITTEDVNTTSGAPLTPNNWYGLKETNDIETLHNQKLVNWFLAEEIVKDKEELEHLLWVGPTPPVTVLDFTYVFWFHSVEKNLYIWDQDVEDYVLVLNEEELENKFVKRSGDVMTGSLDFQLGDKTAPQFLIRPNVGQVATNLYTTQNGQMRFRTSHTEDPNDYDGSHIILDPNSGDPVTRISKLQYPTQEDHASNKEYVDDRELVLQGQIDDGLETQAEIQGQIEELGNKISALEGSVIDANWEFTQSNSAPRPGEFGLYVSQNVGATSWNTATLITINTTDSAGDVYTFDKITVNDVIRMGAENGTSAEYKITAIAVPGMYSIEYLRGSGTPTDNTLYAFTFLSAFDPEGLATIDYVDNQDDTRVKKSGDTMTGAINWVSGNNVLEMSGDDGSIKKRYIKIRGNNELQILGYPGQENQAWKAVMTVTQPAGESPQLLFNYINDPTANGHAVNLRYANNSYLKLSGGTLTGNVIQQGGTHFFRDADGNEKARIQGSNGFIRTYDQFRADRTNDANAYEARMNGTTNATITSSGKATFKGSVKKDGKELATEEFVTNSLPAAPDLSNYVTKNLTETITGKKTFGSSHSSSTTAIEIKGRLQINNSSGATGQVLTSQGTGGTIKWDNLVKTTSSAAGTGGFYQANGALYYVTL